MKRCSFLFLVLILFSAKPVFADAVCTYRPSSLSHVETSLSRGINLSGWWESSRKNKISSQDLRTIKTLGFDFVRIPVSSRWLRQKTGQEKVIQELRCDLVATLHNGLSIVLDLHDAENPDSPDMLSTLESLWHTLRPAVDGLPEDRVFLGLLNEPSDKIQGWWALQGKLITALRPLYPGHTFIASDFKGGYWGLKNKAPYDDNKVMYDFHFYQPMFFTHHNAPWQKQRHDRREKTDRLKYPSSLETDADPEYELMTKYKDEDWNKKTLGEKLKPVFAWSHRTGAKLICLEFGVFKPFVDGPSRARWLKDVREILEENGISRAFWEYNLGFGLVDNNGEPDPNVVAALGLP